MKSRRNFALNDGRARVKRKCYVAHDHTRALTGPAASARAMVANRLEALYVCTDDFQRG